MRNKSKAQYGRLTVLAGEYAGEYIVKTTDDNRHVLRPLPTDVQAIFSS